MKRGIYLVANYKSQNQCANLIYSIKQSGCVLPIRVIHFGGRKIDSAYILNNTEYLLAEKFPTEAVDFISKLRGVLTDCPLGFLYRFLAFFHDWEQFIYSDNDIVALCNWERLFDFSDGYDIVHADEEYKTNGRFNYDKPKIISEIFGINSLETAITAGHFLVNQKENLIKDIERAILWYKENPGIAKNHDQALLHIASLIGDWKMLNLCKPPYNWLSSWSGDYKNSFQLITEINTVEKRSISHIHYSGNTPRGNLPLEDLLLSNLSVGLRLNKYLRFWCMENLYLNYSIYQIKRIKRKIRHLF